MHCCINFYYCTNISEHCKEPLDNYVKEHLPKVRVIHSSERLGLIRARLLGAKHAKGDVIIFLDSHCEANVNWLPPLLGMYTLFLDSLNECSRCSALNSF